MKISALVLLVFSLLSCHLRSGEQRVDMIKSDTQLIPRDVLLGNPEKTQARISKDGQYLSYLAPDQGVLNVWVAPIDAPDQARVVTEDRDRGIRNHHWAHTDKHILYLQDQDGNEDWHIHRVNIETGEVKNLTPFEGVRAEFQGSSYRHPHEYLIRLNRRDPQFHDVYRLNILSGEMELVLENDQYASFDSDLDLQIRFAQRYDDDGNIQIYRVLEREEGGVEPYLTIPADDTMNTGFRGFNKDGTKIYLQDSRGRDTSALKVMDIESKEEALVTEHDKADLGSVYLHPTERRLQAVNFEYQRKEWEFFDAKFEADYELLGDVDEGDIEITSRSRDDQVWIVAFAKDDGPVAYYRFDRESSEASFLFNDRPRLERYELAPMEPLVIESRDGLEMVSYLTRPRLQGQQAPFPMVLLVHGGPWARDTWGFHPYHQLLANRGYAVLSVNFRGSAGFGKEFLNAGRKEWGAKMHDDLIDAVEWAVEQGIADEERVAIMGGSYGGYATLAGLTFTPKRFACGVDIVGPSNLITLLETIPPYWGPALQMFQDRVGNPETEEGRKLLKERSPLFSVENIERPLLIAQGANDPRVKQNESDQIVDAMVERDIPVTYVLYPDEGHGFARPENSKAFIAVTEAFLAQCIGGRYEEVGDAFEGASLQVPQGREFVPGLREALKERE